MIEDHEELKYAAKVYISLIKSPLYDSQSNHTPNDLLIDIELKNYFSRPKQFKLNDIIFIKSIIKKNYVVYQQFKIVRVEPENLMKNSSSFLIDNKRTQLIKNESQIREKWHWLNFK